MTPESFLHFAINYCYFFLVLSYMFFFMRLCRGPGLADRVVALDGIGSVSLVMICVYMIHYRELSYMDVILTMTLINFLGTVAVARYLERGIKR